MPAEFFFKDRSSLLAQLQQDLCAQLESTLAHSARASLFLSGGSTPVPLYKNLASLPLPWQRLHVALVDERWVPLDSAASNERMLRETLLVDAAATVQFTGMKNALSLTGNEDAEAVDRCNALYAGLPHPYSAALLGMGPDGHAASLFPHAKGLAHALRVQEHCAAIHAIESAVTGQYTQRMTMTPWSLLQCERLFLLFTGDDKRAVYENAKTIADPVALPTAVFLQQTTAPVDVYWCP